MKKLSLAFLLIFISLCNAQNALKIEYELKKNLANINGLNKLSDEARVKIMAQMNKPEKETLYYYKGNSFYTNEEKLSVELSNTTSKTNENTTFNKKSILSGTKTRYYKSKEQKGVYAYYDFSGDEFYNLINPMWKKIDYKQETQKIDDFDCKLIELMNDKDMLIKVWYTDELPINAGPRHYIGFPGLVMKVETPSFTIYATKISNDAKESDIDKINPALKVYEGNDFDKKMEEVKQNMAQPKQTKRTVQL